MRSLSRHRQVTSAIAVVIIIIWLGLIAYAARRKTDESSEE